MTYHIPPNSLRPSEWPCYFPELVSEPPQHGGLYDYKETSQAFQEIPYYPHICLDGHFPSEKYWSHCRKHVIRAFNIPWHGGKKENKEKEIIGIHVRRGDYLNYPVEHPVVTEAYLKKAILYFVERGYFRFGFFSEDMQWCRNFYETEMKQLSDQLGIYFHFNDPVSAKTDLSLFSSYDHQILSNSSYSVWGAHLNQNPGKIVIAPKKWTNLPVDKWDTSEICPEGWIIM